MLRQVCEETRAARAAARMLLPRRLHHHVVTQLGALL
jgi:hypothetical protein